jgi:hypothetical protein
LEVPLITVPGTDSIQTRFKDIRVKRRGREDSGGHIQ